MRKFVKFEKMITPIFIQITFWIGLLFSIVSGISLVGYGVISSSGGFIHIIYGLLSMFIGSIIIIIYS